MFRWKILQAVIKAFLPGCRRYGEQIALHNSLIAVY